MKKLKKKSISELEKKMKSLKKDEFKTIVGGLRSESKIDLDPDLNITIVTTQNP